MKETKLNEKNAKSSYDYLTVINASEPEKQKELLKKWGSITPLNFLLSINFNSKIELDLPEGMPPYKRDEATHPDLFSPLAGQIQRLVRVRKPSEMRKMDRERVFIQVLENVSPQEADVLCAAKDKSLHEMFPNITSELVKSVFPGYVA